MEERHPLTDELAALLPGDSLRLSEADRLLYSRDCWPRALLSTLAGDSGPLPMAVAAPPDVETLLSVVRACLRHRTPMVPFGGGSGVCGGVTPVRGGVTIDMKHLKDVGTVNAVNKTVEVMAGALGSHLEEKLNAQGYTLGHFPSSLMCSTLGGWLATRSAGQCSSRYGKIEDMVAGLEFIDGQGRLLRFDPPSAHLGALDMPALVMGSEGVLGIVTRAWLKVHPLPESRLFGAFSFPGVGQGLTAMRHIMQAGLRPAVLRLYDPLDTVVNRLGGQRHQKTMEQIARAQPSLVELVAGDLSASAMQKLYRSLLGQPMWINLLRRLLPDSSQLVMVMEGGEKPCRLAFDAAASLCAAEGGEDLGEEPSRRWYEHRFDISFRQIDVFLSGGVADTMEVAAPWEQVETLYHEVRKALQKDAFVMAHFSHAYPEGCALYFTMAAAGGDGDLAPRLETLWNTALKTVLEHGGVVSHHHGIGLSKANFMLPEHGGLMGAFGQLKQNLDPDNLMNPLKLGL